MPHRRCKNTTLGLGYTDIDGVIAMCQCLTDLIIIGRYVSLLHILIRDITPASHS